MLHGNILRNRALLLLCIVFVLLAKCNAIVVKDIADESLEDVDGIIQETEGITVEEYTDDGNQPVPPGQLENTDATVNKKTGHRRFIHRDSTDPPLGSLHQLSMNPNGLSITSFIFNPTQTTSPWVDRILGSKAVYHNRSSGHSPLFRDPLSPTEIKARTDLFRRVFQLPQTAIMPACSFEILGFGRLEVDLPFKENFKYGNTPSVGKAELKIDKINTTWPCFYRGVYENWRYESENTKPNFWSVLMYCPAPQQIKSCDEVRVLVDSRRNLKTRLKGSIEATIRMYLRKTVWEAEFGAYLVLPSKDPGFAPQLTPPQGVTNIMRGMDTSRHYVNSPLSNIAICLVVPYTTNDADKRLANGAMLYEWIRYHTKIGLKVIVYDRDRANWQYIFNSTYARDLGITKQLDLDYYGYTLRGLLDPSKAGLTYDNTEADIELSGSKLKDRKSRYENQGHDKVLTLTQCRFEAKAIHNIDTVLVVDFDEFLFCPIAHPAPRAQATFFHNFVQYHHGRGIEQVMLPQRLVSNTTESTRDCVVEKVKGKKSFFSCFAPFEFYMGGHSVKSLHIGHVCPVTGYHQACPGLDAPRSYDCVCDNHQTRQNPWRPFQKNIRNRECAVVHLSTNKNNYKKYRFKSGEVEKMRSEPNELYKVLYYHDKEEKGRREEVKTKTTDREGKRGRSASGGAGGSSAGKSGGK